MHSIGRPGIWLGALIGLILTAPLTAIFYCAYRLVNLPFVPFHIFDWQTRVLPGSVVTAGIEAMGLQFVVKANERLPQLNSVTIPAGVDEAAVRKQLLDQYSLEIGAGLGSLAGKVWRIGLMGYACNQKNVLLCLGALDAVLSKMNAPIKSGVAVKAAMEVYAK